MKHYAIIARIAAGIMLITAWGLTDSPLLGVVFILVLTALSAIRYRFKPYKWLHTAEGLICVFCAFFWLPALLGFWFIVISFLENGWKQKEAELLQNDYKNRSELLKLEREREAAALELRSKMHLTELSERTRIAQDIHDHVGHEVSGALIALQTALKLYENGDSRAGELLNQTVARLESASANLRETVHNLKPAQTSGKSGVELLKELCVSFTFCGTTFSASGNLNGFNNWDMLITNLKEALTNIARHSNATHVEIRLDGNKNHIRMMISDNGKKSRDMHLGLGLTGMRERVHAAKGTMTVNTDNGFKIICVVPK
ncbi:MAG: sensor histidine kinase [Oscillospiraceae bacterium]|nr:sensor histidine kinase [Oscillospiraceae bacterium]